MPRRRQPAVHAFNANVVVVAISAGDLFVNIFLFCIAIMIIIIIKLVIHIVVLVGSDGSGSR